MQHSEFLNKLEDQRIIDAIAVAEAKSSGEIRVFVSKSKPATGSQTLAMARKAFEQLGMTGTKYQNGVLLFFTPATQQFAVLGDSGIHERCGDAFWQEVSATISTLLKEGQFTAAVLAGIGKAGSVLAKHFPRDPDDRNELPNAVERD